MTGSVAGIAGILAVLIGATALVAGALALVVTRRPATALSVLLDLLLAAGLLRLVGEPTWQSTATAAAIVALRRLIGVGLRLSGRNWSSAAVGAGTSSSSAVRRLVSPAWRRSG